MKLIFSAILTSLLFFSTLNAQVVVFHQSADTLLSNIKISLAQPDKLNVEFRSSITYPAQNIENGTLNVYNSADSLVFSTTISTEAEKLYHVYITGLSTTESYSANPNGANVELAATVLCISDLPVIADDETRVVFLHAASDFPTVKVSQFPGIELIPSFAYGETVVMNLKAENNNINFVSPDSTLLLATYFLPLGEKNGQTVVVSLSGFISPISNRNGKVFSPFIYVQGLEGFALSNVTPVVSNKLNINDLKVFPNPSRGLLNMSFQSSSTLDVRLSVTNTTGQLVFETTEKMSSVGQKSLQVNLDKLQNGHYFYRLSQGEYSSAGSFVLSK